MADYLIALWPSMPGSLLGTEARRQMADLAARLPPFQVAGFEVELDGSEPVADFAVCVSPFDNGGRGARSADGWAKGLGPVDVLLAHLDEPGSVLRGRLDPVWLEFDVSRTVAQPALFFHPPPDGSLVDLTDEVLCALLGKGMDAGLRSRLEPYGAPPLRGSVFTIGMMLSRDTDALRIGLEGVVPEMMGGLLNDLGWRGSTSEIEATVASVSPHVDTVSLTLDLGPQGVGHRVGLECAFAGPRDRVPPQRWGRLLDALVAAGLCLPERRSALLDWVGVTRERDNPAAWPANLVGLDLLFQPYEPCLHRGLHHVKTVHDGSGRVRAKGYFGYMLGWLAA